MSACETPPLSHAQIVHMLKQRVRLLSPMILKNPERVGVHYGKT